MGDQIKYNPALERGISSVKIVRVTPLSTKIKSDHLAKEEPLEIGLSYGPANNRSIRTIAVTMRTPGYEKELAIGFLFTESIISSLKDILQIRYTVAPQHAEFNSNSVLVELPADSLVDLSKLDRNSYTTSSCGVCGKSSVELIFQHSCYQVLPGRPKIQKSVINSLLSKIATEQTIFNETGGNHAVALFDNQGDLVFLMEDIGRHNAMDKLIGKAVLELEFPLSDYLVLVSGRASFELMQKASMAGIPILVAVGAPSSLAVQMAEEYGMTLIGFLKPNKFNIYAHSERIII